MRKAISRFRTTHESWLLLVIVVLITLLSLANPAFLTIRNISDLLTTNAYIGILSAGLVVVLIAGGIDVSFTATASVAQYIALSYALKHPAHWLVTFGIACAVGILCGFINAALIYKFRIRSIIATIATLNVFYGLLITASGGNWLSVLPDWFGDGIDWLSFTDGKGITYSLNLQIVVLVLGLVSTWILLNRSNIGRQIYAMGGNPDAADRLGLGMFRLHLIVYGYMGLMAGAASIVQAQLAQSVMPNSLVGKELDVLAAVVLGGASLIGGVGTVFGTVLGVALLAIMQNGLLLIGVSSYWLQFFSGLVILIAMSATALQMRRAQTRRRAIA